MKTKKIIAIALFAICLPLQMQAQQIYNEVTRMQKMFLASKQDKSKSLDERKIASFKWDAIEYMLYKAKDDTTFTEKALGEQTYAMTDFVNLFVKRLSEAGKDKSKREIVFQRFKNASINNSLFNDMDKDLVLAYYNSEKFITQFSLDTNWVKALAEIRSKSWE